jgi:hypothetical protein
MSDTEKNGVVELDSLSEVAARIWQTPEQCFLFRNAYLHRHNVSIDQPDLADLASLGMAWFGIGKCGYHRAISLAGIVCRYSSCESMDSKRFIQRNILGWRNADGNSDAAFGFLSHSFVVSQGAYFFYMIVFEVCIAYSMAGMLAKNTEKYA